MASSSIDLILFNAKISTLSKHNPTVSALAISKGKVVNTGTDDEILSLADKSTQVIDVKKKRVIPGLNDSHTHLIRGGLSYNLELRWEGEPSLSLALEKLRIQAQNTPAPQWVRVVGGWSEFQFAERRMPTLDEINKAAPDTPVFILHLYGRALLNKAAIRVLGINQKTPNPPGGLIERDGKGNPTGMLIAKPSALILYSTLSQGPSLPPEYQYNSTRHFMRELNRLGVTSVIDAGGGGQQYPDDYEVVQELHKNNELTVRIAYNLFAQKKGEELADFKNWTETVPNRVGDNLLRHNGAGENLTWSAADFENFLEPRPDLEPIMEKELEEIVKQLVIHRWPFRIHATYDETIDRFLTVFERVNREIPFDGLRFIIDHAETITERNIERVKALGGGIAVQHRMAFQGEYFIDQYGEDAAKQTPPVAKMLAMDVPVGAGTDATRVASYNPWVALYWLVTGKTLGGVSLYDDDNRIDRETALFLWTKGSSWFSGDEEIKGTLVPGALADLAVLNDDYMSVPDDDIKTLYSELTIMDGKIVHGSGGFGALAPSLPSAMPEWSPVNAFGGHYGLPQDGQLNQVRNAQADQNAKSGTCCSNACAVHGHHHNIAWQTPLPINEKAKSAFWGAIGCSCFAV